MTQRNDRRAPVALTGAALAGLGLVMWLASQWAGWGAAVRFTLVQLVLVVGLAGAALSRVAGVRAAWALLGWLAIGALLALIGQTYQLGADPWQLFALWTLLGLPVALAARHDAVWSAWALVAVVAVALWLAVHQGRWGWGVAPPAVMATAALLLVAIWLAMGPWAARGTDCGRWPARVALVAALGVLVGAGVMAVLQEPGSSGWWLALAAVLGLAGVLTQTAFNDLAQRAAVALALLVLGVAALARRLLDGGGSFAGPLLVLGVAAAGLLAALTWALLRLHAARGAASPTWPLAALTALGAWLAAVPLLAGLGLWLGTSFESAFWAVGLALWAVAVAVLRRPALGAFVQHLMTPVLLAGGVALAVGVGVALARHASHLPWQTALAGLGAALGAAALVPQPWLRGVLGALALVPAFWWLHDQLDDHPYGSTATIALVLLLPWLLAGWLRRARWRDAAPAPAWLGWAAGWLALAMWSGGPTFLVAGLSPSLGGASAGSASAGAVGMAASALLALVALAWAARRWPQWRAGTGALVGAGAAVVALALAAAVPPLGGVFLVGVLAAGLGVRALVALAVLAALWLVGTLYAQLAWPLAYKGLALLVAGALLALAVWRPGRVRAPLERRPAALLLGALVATLALANHSIWRHEHMLAEGRTVYLRLAPVDPRSLMQGDYMRLAFALPPEVARGEVAAGERVRVRVDAQGVGDAHALLAADAPVPPGELALALRRMPGGWTVVTDAYHFPEGQAQRFERARYGVLRVRADGSAVLTGLADEQRQPL